MATRSVLIPTLAIVGALCVLSSVSWFRTMEVSAPHIAVRAGSEMLRRVPHVAALAMGDDPAAVLASSPAEPTRSPTPTPVPTPAASASTGGTPIGSSASVPASAPAANASAGASASAGMPAAAERRECKVSPTVSTVNSCLLSSVASPSNVIINSCADSKYELYAVNYVKALRAVNVTNFVMGALDEAVLKTFQGMSVPSFSLANISAGARWHATNRQKIRVVLAFIELGFGILFTDIDVMFMSDPMPFIDEWPMADQLVSSDMMAIQRRSKSKRLEDVTQFKQQHAAPLNVGIMLVRPTEVNIKFTIDWLTRSNREMDVSMQAIYDILLRTNHTCKIDEEVLPELATCYKPALRIGLLPIDRFANGYTYFITHLHEKQKVDVIAVHGTFQVHQATIAKIHRFREARLFFDHDDYYRASRRYMTYEPTLPEWMVAALNGSRALPHSPRDQLPLHFEVMHSQFAQLRDALAIALALDRTLILPKFHCVLDNSWYALMGAWPGFRLQGPFHCPADHLLNFDGMKAQFGLGRYREHSFLLNPRTPAVLKAPPRVVAVVPRPAKGAGDGAGAADTAGPHIPLGASSEEVLFLLAGLNDPVIHFTNMVGAFSRFSAQSEQDVFEYKIKRVPTLWCCLDGRIAREFKQKFPPGHIYYDPYFDRPHTDRFGRVYGATWEFRTGELAFN